MIATVGDEQPALCVNCKACAKVLLGICGTPSVSRVTQITSAYESVDGASAGIDNADNLQRTIAVQ